MQTIKLLSRRKAAPTLFVLEFERPADYSFRAGQFARLGMELEPGAAPVIRGYSIASNFSLLPLKTANSPRKSPHSNPDSPSCWTAPPKAA